MLATRLRCPSCPQRWRCLTSLMARHWPCSSRYQADRRSRGGTLKAQLQHRQHTGEHFEPQIFFVAQAVGAALDHPDLIVEPLDKAERDLVLRLAVGGDPVPVTIDHFGELLIGLEPLPLEALSPVLKETPRPALTLVTPQLAKTLLEDIGRVEPLVGRKQRLQCLLAVEWPRCRITWNLSNKIAACGACAAVASRNGFHMSITASRMRALFFSPSQA